MLSFEKRGGAKNSSLKILHRAKTFFPLKKRGHGLFAVNDGLRLFLKRKRGGGKTFF